MAEYIIGKGSKLAYEIDGEGGMYIAVPDNVESIVRCRYCKHYMLDFEIDAEQEYCKKLSMSNGEPLFPSGNGFCAWGERRE